jgi:hypothetical protein
MPLLFSLTTGAPLNMVGRENESGFSLFPVHIYPYNSLIKEKNYVETGTTTWRKRLGLLPAARL